jgi:hypothetical protein
MTKYGYVFEKDFRIKFLEDLNVFAVMAKRIKAGGVKQTNGWYLNPLPTIPTETKDLYIIKDMFHEGNKNRTILFTEGVVYLSREAL